MSTKAADIHGLSSKLAATAAKSFEDKLAVEGTNSVQDPVETTTMQTGAQSVGQNVAGAHNAQGRYVMDTRAPGYYSIHCGCVYLTKRRVPWPMHMPLVPDEDDEELIAYLDHLVKTGKATKVEAPKK